MIKTIKDVEKLTYLQWQEISSFVTLEGGIFFLEDVSKFNRNAIYMKTGEILEVTNQEAYDNFVEKMTKFKMIKSLNVFSSIAEKNDLLNEIRNVLNSVATNVVDYTTDARTTQVEINDHFKKVANEAITKAVNGLGNELHISLNSVTNNINQQLSNVRTLTETVTNKINNLDIHKMEKHSEKLEKIISTLNEMIDD